MHYLIYDLREDYAPLLTPEHLDATERAAYAARGEKYLVMRTILRRELARRSGRQPEEILFTYGENGKPEFSPLHFNISHSGDKLALAFHDMAVGIDIELMRPRTQMRNVARRIMCPEQWEEWNAGGCSTEEFYNCWCVTEALVKMDGTGILHSGDHPFLLKGGDVRLLNDSGVQVELITPSVGYAGAVAYRA